jgi:hypothetical protein
MLTIDWTRYVGAQMEWAETLTRRAEEIPGYDAEQLRAKSAGIMADVSRKVGREVSTSQGR